MADLTAMMYLVGAGSMTLGVEAAGFKVQKILETPGYSKNARSWDLNRPDLRHEVLELDHRDDHFKQYSGIDLLAGNPPCGGVSNMTRGGANNPTNTCMRLWVRMVVKARPRMILMESGYQLDTPKYEKLLGDLTNVLDAHGYWHWTWQFRSYQVGTPQIRRRMFLLASLDQPVHDCWLDLTDLEGRRPTTCRALLEPLEGVVPSPEPVTDRLGRQVTHHWYDHEGQRCTVHVAGNRHYVVGGGYITPKQLVTHRRVAERVNTDKAWREYRNAEAKLWPDCPAALDYSAFFKKLVVCEYDQPAKTMIGVFKFVHPMDDRLLTMKEMALLMGYPPDWRFTSCNPHYAIQGVPSWNSQWAADRLLKALGLRG